MKKTLYIGIYDCGCRFKTNFFDGFCFEPTNIKIEEYFKKFYFNTTFWFADISDDKMLELDKFCDDNNIKDIIICEDGEYNYIKFSEN